MNSTKYAETNQLSKLLLIWGE